MSSMRKIVIFGSFPLLALMAIMILFAQGDRRLVLVAQAQNTAAVSPVESQRALVNQYCAGCHSDSVKSGGFTWSAVDLAHPEQNGALAERIIKKVRSGMMPPPGARRPDASALKNFA